MKLAFCSLKILFTILRPPDTLPGLDANNFLISENEMHITQQLL